MLQAVCDRGIECAYLNGACARARSVNGSGSARSALGSCVMFSVNKSAATTTGWLVDVRLCWGRVNIMSSRGRGKLFLGFR